MWWWWGAAQLLSPSDKFPEVQQSKDNPNRKGLFYLIKCQVSVMSQSRPVLRLLRSPVDAQK